MRSEADVAEKMLKAISNLVEYAKPIAATGRMVTPDEAAAIAAAMGMIVTMGWVLEASDAVRQLLAAMGPPKGRGPNRDGETTATKVLQEVLEAKVVGQQNGHRSSGSVSSSSESTGSGS